MFEVQQLDSWNRTWTQASSLTCQPYLLCVRGGVSETYTTSWPGLSDFFGWAIITFFLDRSPVRVFGHEQVLGADWLFPELERESGHEWCDSGTLGSTRLRCHPSASCW